MYIGSSCLFLAVAVGLASFLISLPKLKKEQAEQIKLQQNKEQQQ